MNTLLMYAAKLHSSEASGKALSAKLTYQAELISLEAKVKLGG